MGRERVTRDIGSRGIVRKRKFTEYVSDHPGLVPRLCIAGAASAGHWVILLMQMACPDTGSGGGGGRRKWDGLGREMMFSARSLWLGTAMRKYTEPP